MGRNCIVGFQDKPSPSVLCMYISHVRPDFERQFPPSEVGGVRSQRSSHSSLLNGVLPPLDGPLNEEEELPEEPILPPPAAFQSSTYIGEVDPPSSSSSVHSPRHGERGSERRGEVGVVSWGVVSEGRGCSLASESV